MEAPTLVLTVQIKIQKEDKAIASRPNFRYYTTAIAGLLKTQGIVMKNTRPHIHQDKTQTRQLPKLQPLKLEHLSCVAGGTFYVYSCPDCPE